MKRYMIIIKANWNDLILATWEFPSFLAKDIETVRSFVRDHIYSSPVFSDCTCAVREVDS